MTAQLPPEGLPLRPAFAVLIHGPQRQTFEQFGEAEALLPEAALRPSLRILWTEILRQEQAGEVAIYGHRPGSATPERINRGLLHGSMPNLQRSSITTDAGEFVGITVGPARADATVSAVAKGKGGRPAKFDWDAFDQEVVRFALTPDGFETRHQLMTHMQDWCSRKWDEQPDPETVRRRVARTCPPELPEN